MAKSLRDSHSSQVNLPAAGTLVVVAAVFNKTNYISQGIVEKDADLVRKILSLVKTAFQSFNGCIYIKLSVSVSCQKSSHAGSA